MSKRQYPVPASASYGSLKDFVNDSVPGKNEDSEVYRVKQPYSATIAIYILRDILHQRFLNSEAC